MPTSYIAVAKIVHDTNLRERLIACAATEHKPNPMQWVIDRIWELAATPGWGDAWEYALLTNIVDPGLREDVISDGAILAAIQPMD